VQVNGFSGKEHSRGYGKGCPVPGQCLFLSCTDEHPVRITGDDYDGRKDNWKAFCEPLPF